MRLWLVRHAVVPHTAGLCYGASDLAADPHATEAAAERLAQVLPPGTPACCSPLQRCRSLADCLQALRPDLAISSDARLAEMDFGRWEGQAWDAIGEAELSAWTADFASYRPGGGEALAVFMGRVGAALQGFSGAGADTGLWITHAGVIKAVQWLASGRADIMRADQWPAGSLACGQWTVLDLPPSGSAAAAPA